MMENERDLLDYFIIDWIFSLFLHILFQKIQQANVLPNWKRLRWSCKKQIWKNFWHRKHSAWNAVFCHNFHLRACAKPKCFYTKYCLLFYSRYKLYIPFIFSLPYTYAGIRAQEMVRILHNIDAINSNNIFNTGIKWQKITIWMNGR